MCEVYYVNKLIKFQPFADHARSQNGFIVDRAKDLSIEWLLGLLEQTPSSSELILFSDNPGHLKIRFEKLFVGKFVAGGLVLNPSGELLFIKKNGYWDLPKGYLEPNETPACAARREVEEETGIGGLEIVSPLIKTKHFFQENDGQWILKQTNWFLMKTLVEAQPRIDRQEGISDAKWVSKGHLDAVLANSHASIRQVVAAGG